MTTDASDRERVRTILIRESRSLFQYLREVPPWVGPNDINALARLRELASAEHDVIEELARWLQKNTTGTAHLGAFPDFTPYNDAALHFLLPMISREQKQLIAELERDRPGVADSTAGAMLDRLRDLKHRHLGELNALHAAPHTFTAVNV